jgi:hypothetical protein
MAVEGGVSWPEQYRAALEEAGTGRLYLDEDLVAAVLAVAKEVAHGSERRYAPLATFLAGQYVARRRQDGVTVAAALAEARSIARQLLPAQARE